MNWPGGSFPITSRTSWPSSRSAAACSSACSTTAPQKDHENGTTMPDFHPARVYAPAQCADAARRRPPRDPDHRRRATERRLLHPRARPAAGEEDGQPGRSDRLPPLLRGREGQRRADITFFEYPGATRGKAGAGMVHTIVWRVSSRRRSTSGSSGCKPRPSAARAGESLTFEDPEGVRHELRVVETEDEPLVAKHPEIPEEHALQGFDGVRAYAVDPERSSALLEDTLGFQPAATTSWRRAARGGAAGTPTTHRPRGGIPGAGTVHHVAGRRRSTITTTGRSGSPRPDTGRRR